MRSTWMLVPLLGPMTVACAGSSADPDGSPPGRTLEARLSCADAVQPRVLPTWAAGGFTDPSDPVPLAVGARKSVVGVVFGYPLHAPRHAPDHLNKILWVAAPDVPLDPDAAVASQPGLLRIDAALQGSDLRVVKEVALGPSHVDMPRPGCWIFTLSWAGHRDRVAIPYEPS